MIQDQKIDIKQALRVFDLATNKGEKRDDGWHYRGLTVSTDFDGYTVFIESQTVRLTIFFHNKFTVECKNAFQLQEFTELLKKIDRD